jgi:hypothetical protein
VIADYDRRNFSVSQCRWDSSSQTAQSIVAILPPSNETSNATTSQTPTSTPLQGKNNAVPIVAIAGGAGGGVVLVISAIALCLFLRHKKKAKKVAEENAAAAKSDDTILKPELDGYERLPKIYETAPEVDVEGDAKKFTQSMRAAVEIGDPGRNSPVYEMAAEEVAVEMPGVGKAGENAGRRSLGPRSPFPGNAPSENSRFVGDRRTSGSMLASPVSWTMSPGSPGSSVVSPTSVIRGAGVRSPRSATNMVSPNSSVNFDRSPVNELFYTLKDST